MGPTAAKNFWPAFWIMAAGHELATTFADYDGKEEFDYGFDPLSLRPEDPEEQKKFKTMELNHGRWAMFCAAGIIGQELATGKSILDFGSAAVEAAAEAAALKKLPRSSRLVLLRVLNFLSLFHKATFFHYY